MWIKKCKYIGRWQKSIVKDNYLPWRDLTLALPHPDLMMDRIWYQATSSELPSLRWLHLLDPEKEKKNGRGREREGKKKKRKGEESEKEGNREKEKLRKKDMGWRRWREGEIEGKNRMLEKRGCEEGSEGNMWERWSMQEMSKRRKNRRKTKKRRK